MSMRCAALRVEFDAARMDVKRRFDAAGVFPASPATRYVIISLPPHSYTASDSE